MTHEALNLFEEISKTIGTANPVFYRTYSRKKPDGRRETWGEVCDRTIQGLSEVGKLTASEAKLIKSMQLQMKCLTSGRWLWVGGTDWIKKPLNHSGAYNCVSTNITDWLAFKLTMALGMMGCGTGTVLLPEYIDQLPPIINSLKIKVTGEFGATPIHLRREETFIHRNNKSNVIIFVGDSRQGWVDSYGALLELASDPTMDEEILVTVSVSDVRPANEPLKGFGGTSNPIKLPDLYPRCADILNKAVGRKLTSVECCLLIDEAAAVYVAGNVRRCLPEDALVHTEKGLIPIKDVNVGDYVYTPLGFRRVLNKFDQGEQDVVVVKTNASYMRATANHRVAVMTDAIGGYEWKKVEDLVLDDRLMFSHTVLPGHPTSLPEDNTQNRPKKGGKCNSIVIPNLDTDVAWMIGFLHGNGYAGGSQVVFAGNAREPETVIIREKLERAIAKFGLEIVHDDSQDGGSTYRGMVYSVRLSEYLQQFKQARQPLSIPDCILQGTPDIRAAYLAGLIDSDGSVKGRVQPISTIYRSFRDQVAVLYASLGIPVRPRQIKIDLKNKAKRPRFILSLIGFRDQYNHHVAPYSAKGQVKTIKQSSLGFTLPCELLKENYAHAQIREFTSTPAKTCLYERYVATTGVDLDIPVTVKEIERIEVAHTWDIEVEEAHCFYADGFLTHNSAGMRQGASDDQAFAVAKDNLWGQDEDGNWRIDPERDVLRMANHTRVFFHKPSLEETVGAVRKQFYSGEGAIQYAPELVARCNADIINTPEKRAEFFSRNWEGQKAYIKELMIKATGDCDPREYEHRISRFGLNPCLAGETKVKVWGNDQWTLLPIKELAESGENWDVCDGNGDRVSVQFRKTGMTPGLVEITYERDDEVHFIRCTRNHNWFVHRDSKTPMKLEASQLLLGDRLVTATSDPNPEPWMITGLRLLTLSQWEDVYCTTVPTTHSFDLEDLHTGNCGEIGGANFHCDLAEIHLNQINPLDLQEQIAAFTAGAISVASLLHHEFVLNERYQYSRSIDPIVGVSFTGLFDFFVELLGTDWLKWWEAGRPKDWRSDDSWSVTTDVSPEYKVDAEHIIVLPSEIHAHINGSRSLGDVYNQIERIYLQFWREIVEQQVRFYCDKHGLRRPNRCTTVQPAGCLSREHLRIFDNGLIYADEVLNPGSGETKGLGLSVRNGIPVSTGIANEPLQLVKVTLENGRILRMTPNHRLSIGGEWVHAADMAPGMKIDFSLGEYQSKQEASFQDLNQFSYEREGRKAETGHNLGVLSKTIATPKTMCPELAYFLGALFGNGCLSQNKYRVRFTVPTNELALKLQGIARQLFNLDGCISQSSGRNDFELSFGSRQLYDWFHLNGLAKTEKSKNLERIPLAIRCSSTESILSFFCGLIDTDGCIRKGGSLSIDSASESFLRNLQQVGEAVGLCFTLFHNTEGKNLQGQKDMWGLCLSRMLSLPDAVNYINRHSYKAQKRPIPPVKRTFKFDPYKIVSVEWEQSPDYSYDFAVEGVDDDDSWYWQGGIKSHNTKSLLTGASPGWHPPKSHRYIRRITFSKDHPVAKACMDLGYSVIPSQSDKDEQGNLLNDPFDPRCTEWLVEIPVELEWANIPGADQVDISKFSALAQMDFYMNIQQVYARHNSSATIELREHEIEELGTRIYNLIQDDEGYVSVALLARFDNLQTFPRLPFEPIDKTTYDRLITEVESRRKTDDFHAALSQYDVSALEIEAGPAGCDSSACLMPEKK